MQWNILKLRTATTITIYDNYMTFIMYMLLIKVCGVMLTYCHYVHVGDTRRGHWFTQYFPLMAIGWHIHRHPPLGMTLIQRIHHALVICNRPGSCIKFKMLIVNRKWWTAVLKIAEMSWEAFFVFGEPVVSYPIRFEILYVWSTHYKLLTWLITSHILRNTF